MKTEKTKQKIATPANIITFTRIAILFLVVFLIKTDILWVRILVISLIPVIFYMDSLDGYLARKLKCSSQLGSVLDIVGDRIVENVLWLVLAYLHIIPLWIACLVLLRGFLTDGFKSVAIAQGHTTFSMIKSKLSWWLVASPPSRTSYAILKAMVFTLGLSIWSFSIHDVKWLVIVFHILLFLTVAACVIRGIYAVKSCIRFL